MNDRPLVHAPFALSVLDLNEKSEICSYVSASMRWQQSRVDFEEIVEGGSHAKLASISTRRRDPVDESRLV